MMAIEIDKGCRVHELSWNEQFDPADDQYPRTCYRGYLDTLSMEWNGMQFYDVFWTQSNVG